MKRKDIDYSLYLVTDRRWLGGKSLESAVEEAIQGGATIVQLREKEISSREYLEIAKRVKEIAEKYKAPLIVNDRIDIAFACDAEGVHLGSDDLPVQVARTILGREKIIGASACTLEEALALEAEGADYLGVGAVFPTGTKTDADQVTLDGLADIKAAVKIPVIAIGGIGPGNVAAVMETGVDGVAIVSAIMAQNDIAGAARKFAAILKKYFGGYDGT